MGNPFGHIELTTSDHPAAKKFYAELFDWSYQDMPMEHGVYTLIGVGAGTGGGMQAKPMPDAPAMWLPYVNVKSVQATLDQAVSLGARVLLPFTDIGENGSIGIFADPQGVALGVWAPPASAAQPAAKKAAAGAGKKGAAKKSSEKSARKSSETSARSKSAPAKSSAARKPAAKKSAGKPARKAAKGKRK